MTLQVLVSSTYWDLRAERDAVRAEIESLSREGLDLEWVGMEEFGSLSSTPLESSTGHTAEADLVVLLVGKRYGSLPPADDTSFTEHEFDTVLRERIPCLAYFGPNAEKTSDASARRFQQRVSQEVVRDDFSDVADLRHRVRRDLKRETDHILVSTRAPAIGRPPRPDIFVDREDALRALWQAFESDLSRVAICAPSGMGKTALAYKFLAGTDIDDPDPVWLRMDELFGRHPDGRRRVRRMRWGYEALRQALEDVLRARPGRPIVYDNAQADPRAVRWLVKQFENPALVLSWDAAIVPSGFRKIELGPLEAPYDVDLLRTRCPEEQRHKTAVIEELARLLNGYPLLLDLVGRRLQTSAGLRVEEIMQDVETSKGRLQQEGDTIDKEVVIRSVVRSSFLALPRAERDLLPAMAALPGSGVSQTSLEALTRELGVEPLRPDRAVDLGIVERSLLPDWKGHRYHFREIVLDFFLSDQRLVSKSAALIGTFLSSESALHDDSPDVVEKALELQLERSAPNLPWSGSWLEVLLSTANPALLSAATSALSRVKSTEQRSALIDGICRLLTKPQTIAVTCELLETLQSWLPPQPMARSLMWKLFRRPLAFAFPGSTEPALCDDVSVAAARGLARYENLTLEEWLDAQIVSGDAVQRALACAARAGVTSLIPRFLELLNSDSTKARLNALRNLSGFLSSTIRGFKLPEAVKDRLAALAEGEFDDEVVAQARLVLGLWGDARGIEHMLKAVTNAEDDERATALGTLFSLSIRKRSDGISFPDLTPLVDEILDIALNDENINARVMAATLLSNLENVRAPRALISLLKSGDDYAQQIATTFCGMVASRATSDECADMAELVAKFLDSDRESLSAAARRALLSLRDKRGYDGLWEAVDDIAVGSDWRWHMIGGLRHWDPPGFDATRLGKLLSDRDPKMRAQVIRVIGDRGLVNLMPELKKLLADKSPLPPAFGGPDVATIALEIIEKMESGIIRAREQPNLQQHPT